jgi:hypothetical protein
MEDGIKKAVIKALLIINQNIIINNELIRIMNTVKGRFFVPVKKLLHFSQEFGSSI